MEKSNVDIIKNNIQIAAKKERIQEFVKIKVCQVYWDQVLARKDLILKLSK